jgi:hypothetical protein
MRPVIADVKCYYCGHISGQVEGYRADRLVLRAFKPRPDYQGAPPQPGQAIRCERCRGPVYLEDLRPVLAEIEAIKEREPAPKRKRASAPRAA